MALTRGRWLRRRGPAEAGRSTGAAKAARYGSARGATIVEAALITPLLLLLTFSIVDFASLLYVYLALEHGVSQASRYAVTGSQFEDLSREESIKAAMRQATPTLTIDDDAFSFSHLPAGESTWNTGVGGPDDIDRVTVSYTWSVMTPLIRPFFDNGQITLRVESAMKNERRWE